MDALEQRVLEIQKLPRGSDKRRIVLNRVINDIEKSDKLFCQGRFNYPKETGVYDEALWETLLYISHKIDEYDPNKAKVMTWVNRILEYKFKEAIKKYKKRLERAIKELSLDAPVGKDFDTPLSETIAQPEAKSLLCDRLYDCIDRDPEGLFSERHIRDRPEANFRAMALRFFNGESRRAIADGWGISEQTIYAFVRRSCQKFAPKFREYLQNMEDE